MKSELRMSPKPKKSISRKINTALRQVVKTNLMSILNKSIAKPIKNLMKNKEMIEKRKSKIQTEFHYSPLSKRLCNPNFDKENRNWICENVKYIDITTSTTENNLRNQLKEFARKHNPTPELFEDVIKLVQKKKLDSPVYNEEFSCRKFETIHMTHGVYISFGIENQIKHFYRHDYIKKKKSLPDTINNSCIPTNESIVLDVGVFLVAPKNSPKNSKLPQYMVILGKIQCEVFNDSFCIGIYHGEFPNSTIGNEIMKPFITEMLAFQKKSRVLTCGLNSYNLKLNSFVCDPISNSLITCTSLPNSLHGCSKCNQLGQLEFDLGYTAFPPAMSLAALRSDEDFRYILQNEHHLAVPLLEQLEIGLISQFPIDYKTVVCEGVMKHLLHLWMHDKLDYRLNKKTVADISRDLVSITPYMPREFKGKPKSLEELDKWDAHDFNEFLLYYSPIVLRNRLPLKYYIHFLYLHLAMRILASGQFDTECNSYLMGHLLNKFIAEFIDNYGRDRIDYNVHNLLHIADSQQKLGFLRNLNGFAFENQTGMIESLITESPDLCLEEIGEKVMENSNILLDNKINGLIHENFPYIDDDGSLIFPKFALSCKEPDNHIFVGNGIVRIEEIFASESDPSEIVMIGRRYKFIEIMYHATLTNQKMLQIANLGERHTLHHKEIIFKGVKFNTADGEYTMPLIP